MSVKIYRSWNIHCLWWKKGENFYADIQLLPYIWYRTYTMYLLTTFILDQREHLEQPNVIFLENENLIQMIVQ